jgi:hypothetical protein
MEVELARQAEVHPRHVGDVALQPVGDLDDVEGVEHRVQARDPRGELPRHAILLQPSRRRGVGELVHRRQDLREERRDVLGSDPEVLDRAGDVDEALAMPQEPQRGAHDEAAARR